MVVEDYKNQMRTTLLFVSLVAMSFMFAFRIFYQQHPISRFIHLPFSCLALLGIYFVWKKYKTYKPFDYFMILYACTMQIYISYLLGSYNSAQMFWSFCFMFSFHILYGIKMAFAYYVYFVLAEFLLFKQDPMAIDPQMGTKGVIHFVAITILLYTSYVQQRIFNVYRKYKTERDQNKTLLQIKGGLLHQINNPLSVVQTLVKSDQFFPDKMEMLKRNVERISKVMEALHKVDDLSDLELQNYTQEQDVYLLKSDLSHSSPTGGDKPTEKIS